ncbi:hypothetical protein Rsub_13129 [Raphidocelis subcapitata]|uniref:Uncharacterized protein n=1 Tax=Raphidocelis subcapitata TaxID=307507 RepID=A0A2V0PKS7_9CHLO|nr:hypothetical protein Rsub_13129 [Raphidocelis subcapitata]|eukprot:GBG00405.1 hypothetical protein Rsub_13129 [Raphidocelis subcapitata]
MAEPISFTYAGHVVEHHGRPIYCLSFNRVDPAYKDLLATVGKNRATVYQIRPGGRAEVVQAYTDPDSLKGHGSDIHDIAAAPSRPQLVLTASKDESVRLWSLAGGACVAVFGGEGAHSHEVISLDWHPWRPHLFASAGMDSAVKVWSLKGIWSKVDRSDTWHLDQASRGRAFRAAVGEHPVFSSQRLHGDYVDCVRWLGDLLLSKSVKGEILLTRPEYPDDPALQTSGAFTKLRSFELPSSGMWWVRFSVSLPGDLLVCGNGEGRLFCWDPSGGAGGGAGAVLARKGCGRVVRQTAISLEGDLIAASCDDGSVWIWQKGGGGAGAATGTTATTAVDAAASSGGGGGGGGASAGAASGAPGQGGGAAQFGEAAGPRPGGNGSDGGGSSSSESGGRSSSSESGSGSSSSEGGSGSSSESGSGGGSSEGGSGGGSGGRRSSGGASASASSSDSEGEGLSPEPRRQREAAAAGAGPGGPAPRLPSIKPSPSAAFNGANGTAAAGSGGGGQQLQSGQQQQQQQRQRRPATPAAAPKPLVEVIELLDSD